MRAGLLARGQGTTRGYALLVAVAVAAGRHGATPAFADENGPEGGAAAPAGNVAQVAPTCALKGTFPGPRGTAIFDARSGGHAVATFSGAVQALTLDDFPADPTAGRARVRTSLGASSLRIDGWVAAADVAVFTRRDVPVQSGHVAIADAQRVRLVSASGHAGGDPRTLGLGIEVTVAGTGGQTVRALAPCDALALQPGAATVMAVPGNGRGYLSKLRAVELFDQPAGSAVFSLQVMEGASHLFWSTETRGGFVHVTARGNLAIDAWARLGSLEPLKKGEMMDQFLAPTTAVAGAQLALDRPPRLLTAAREIPLRAHRDEKETPIGAIEAGAEVYVMETLSGWTNVLPRNLALRPADDGGFWVPSAELSP